MACDLHRRRLLLAAMLATAAGAAVLPALRARAALEPGQYVWQPELSPKGPVAIVVNLAHEMAYVYRNGIEIGVSTVSTGRPGFATPTGVFTILQKEAEHHSNEYHDASMPFTERLTWGGVSLHAGGLPGYPSSHGCVHLPLAFARLVYEVTEVGTTVIITDDHGTPGHLFHAGLNLPTVEQVAASATAPAPDDFVWQPQRAPHGPISILVSVADRQAYVYRNGVEIGTAGAGFTRPQEPLLPGVFILLDTASGRPDPLHPGQQLPVWHEIAVGRAGGRSDVPDRLELPTAFARAVLAEVQPGATLDVTLAPAGAETRTGPGFTIAASQPA